MSKDKILVTVDATNVLKNSGNLYTNEPAFFFAIRACNHTWSNRLFLWLAKRKSAPVTIVNVENESEDDEE